MNYFEFLPHDQTRINRLLYSELKEPPWVVLKPRYLKCVCPTCQRIDYDQVFTEGFDEPLKIRAKGDFLGTEDGFICVSENVKSVIDAAQFRGVNLKPASKTGWWVVNVSVRVNADPSAYTMKNPCVQCGRPKQVYGKIACLNQIEAPKDSGMFFSPVLDRGVQPDRDLFVTEDIVSHFKKQGLKGGVFSRLLTPGEHETVKAANALHDPLRWPKDSKVVL